MSTSGTFTTDEIDKVWWAAIIASYISLASTALILFVYITLPNLRQNGNFRYVAYLTISNMLYSLSHAISPFYLHNTTICILFGSLGFYGYHCVCVWTALFTLRIYYLVVAKKVLELDFHENSIIIKLAFGVPLILPIIAAFLDWLGNNYNVTCMSRTGASPISYIVMLYIPGFGTGFLVMGLYGYIMVQIRNTLSPEDAKQMCYEIIWYPVVFWCNFVILFTFSIYQEVSGNSVYILFASGIVLRTFQGFIDSVIYGFNSIARGEIRRYFYQTQLESLRNTRNIEHSKELQESIIIVS